MSATTIETLIERGFVPVLRCGESLFLFADFNADKSVIVENDGAKWVVHSPRSRQFNALHNALIDKGETVFPGLFAEFCGQTVPASV